LPVEKPSLSSRLYLRIQTMTGLLIGSSLLGGDRKSPHAQKFFSISQVILESRILSDCEGSRRRVRSISNQLQRQLLRFQAWLSAPEMSMRPRPPRVRAQILSPKPRFPQTAILDIPMDILARRAGSGSRLSALPLKHCFQLVQRPFLAPVAARKARQVKISPNIPTSEIGPVQTNLAESEPLESCDESYKQRFGKSIPVKSTRRQPAATDWPRLGMVRIQLERMFKNRRGLRRAFAVRASSTPRLFQPSASSGRSLSAACLFGNRGFQLAICPSTCASSECMAAFTARDAWLRAAPRA